MSNPIFHNRGSSKLIAVQLTLFLVLAGLPFIFELGSEHSTVQAAPLTVDDNGGAMYTTIQAAINAAIPGDTIYVWNGTYYENVLVNKCVTLIGNGTTNTTIDGGNIGNGIEITADWVNVTGFTVTNCHYLAPNYLYAIESDRADNVHIYNNNCTNNSNGINIYFSYYNIVENNTIDQNSRLGINAYGADWNKICNNTIITDSWYSIYLLSSNYNFLYNNTCNATSNDCISIASSNQNKVINNTCTSPCYGIKISRCLVTRIKNNTMYSCGIHIYGPTVDYYTWQSMDLSNTVDGRPIYYWKNVNGGVVPLGAAQVLLFNCSNVLVQNQNCSNASLGIHLAYSDNIVIRNNTCSYNYEYGLKIENSNNITLYNNTIHSNNNWGIFISSSNDNILQENIYKNNIDASNFIESCDNNKFINNTIYSNSWHPYYITYSDSNEFYYNTIYSNGGSAFYVWDTCNSNLIINNTCWNNSYGVYMYRSKYNRLENNTFNSNGYSGIHLTGAHENIIINNTCNSNKYAGLHLQSSNNNIIKNNTMNSNDIYGVRFFVSDWNTLEYSNITNNVYGIFARQFADDNTITKNTISSNTNTGILMEMNNKRNYIFHNNLIANTKQAVNNDTNFWNNSLHQGNYWSDYTGLDDGTGGRLAGDGIGDTNIPHLGIDNYPFMDPTGWLYPGIPTLIDPGEYNSTGNYTIAWYNNRRTTGYILEESVNSLFDTPIEIYNGSDLKFDITNKTNGTYYYRLRAYNEKYISDWSNIVYIIVDWPPNSPKNFTVAVYPEGNALNLSWDPNLIDTKQYDIYLKTTGDWGLLQTILHPWNAYNHTSLINGQTYYYMIQAMDNRNQFSVLTNVIEAVPADSVAPSSPSGLSITDYSYDFISLTWDANTESDLQGYNIYRSTISNPTDWGDPINNDTLVVETEYTDNGLDELTAYFYVITALDEVPNESEVSAVAFTNTTLGPHAPELNISVPDFELPEDSYDDSSINLYHWFKDINNDPLTFRCIGQEYLGVTIFQANGTVIIEPTQDWNGDETLTFYANDSKSETYDEVTITVTAVNDPPGPAKILEPENNTEILAWDPLDFVATCYDPDLPYGDTLTYNWTSDICGILGTGDLLSNIELLVGKHKITLTVSDEKDECTTATINVKVNRAPFTDTDKDGLPDTWEQDNGLDPFDPSDAAQDFDNDNLSNYEEYTEDTDPQEPDTDGDGLSDGDEIKVYGTAPTDPDTDGDSYNDKVDAYPLNPRKWEAEVEPSTNGKPSDKDDEDTGWMLAIAAIIIIIIVIILVFIFVIKPKMFKKKAEPAPQTPPQPQPPMMPQMQQQQAPQPLFPPPQAIFPQPQAPAVQPVVQQPQIQPMPQQVQTDEVEE